MASDKTLLIIEDDSDLLELVKRSLEDVFEKIHIVEDPNKALAAFQTYQPHLVICDISLPGRSGIEVIQQARANGHVTPVVFMTGKDDQESILAAIRLGAVDYLIKPISMKDIKKVVERIKFTEEKKSKVMELRAEKTSDEDIAKQERMIGLLQATSLDKKKTGT